MSTELEFAPTGLPGRTRARLASAASAPRKQRGAAMYLFAIVVITAMAAMLAAQAPQQLRDIRAAQQKRALVEMRARVLSYLASPQLALNAVDANRRLGDWRLYPDLPIAAAGGADASEPNYDGQAESAGCAFRGWTPGQALLPVTTSAGAARCFGRLPWRDLGANLGDVAPDTDPDGAVPWLVISPNLAVGAACLPDLTPLLLTRAYAGYGCSGAPPYPWISVRDDRGNVLSDRVAIAIVLPGPPVAGQARGPNAGPDQYLDRVTIQAGCPSPCQPGTYDNAAYNQPDGSPTVLINAPRSERAASAAGFYAQPYAFNDQIVYLTIDDLVGELEQHARRELLNKLRAFQSTQHYFPYASAFTSSTGDCTAGVRYGHPAVNDGGCGTGNSPGLAQWFVDGGWHRYFLYAVSPTCVSGSPSCTGTGLTVGATSGVNALVISPGVPIVSAPYAPAKLGPQIPLLGLLTSLTATAADYVDNPINAGLVPDIFAATAGQAFPQNDRLEIVN